MTAPSVSLLPCPFCGGEPVTSVVPNGTNQRWEIRCDNIDCFGPVTTAFSLEDNAEQWNTRATPPAPTPSDLPSDGTCVRCGAAPRNASGLCATCVDEDAERAGEIPPPPSAARERIARIIDPDAYDEAVAHKPWMKKHQEKAQNKADAILAILALLPDAAAIMAAAFEEAAKIAETCSVKRDWDTEIAAAIRAAGENAK
ncbi:MAG: hypothetical protein WBF99_12595 [Xanthobacteraceae bacterium]